MQDQVDVPYGQGNGRDLLVDVYHPDPAASLRTGVLMFHGGGWRGGSRKNIAPRAQALRAEGFTVMPAEYRLTGESPWPAQIHDVKAAIRWARVNAGDLGFDPGRIVLVGFSAGAHLSLLAAGTVGLADYEGDGGNAGVDTSVAAVAAFYPPASFHTGQPGERGISATLLLGENPDPGEVARASPITHVSPAFPPVLLVHGGADTTVPPSCSTRMYEALRAAGVEADLHLFAGQLHEFDSTSVFRETVAREVGLFFRRMVSERDEIIARINEQSMFARRAAEAAAQAAAGR